MRPGNESTESNQISVNSPHAVTGLTAGGDIIINQGVSEDALLALADVRRIAAQIQENAPVTHHEVDEDLVWRLVDEIKMARRKLEREEVAKLLSDLTRIFRRSGGLLAEGAAHRGPSSDG